jgi:predicted dehydrogenase
MAAGRDLGIGMVGTGFGARVQIPVWSSVPGVRVVSVCSGDRERAEAVAGKCGAPHATSDPAEVARHPDVDLVCVTSPPHQHRPAVLAALAAGKHVLCEKPFALDAVQAFEMREAARRAGVLALVDFEFRMLPARAELRRLLHSGAIGALRHVHQAGRSPTSCTASTGATAPGGTGARPEGAGSGRRPPTTSTTCASCSVRSPRSARCSTRAYRRRVRAAAWRSRATWTTPASCCCASPMARPRRC